MDLPPPDARSSGVLFDRRATSHTIDARSGGVPPRNASEQSERSAEMSSADHARLFGFESELEAGLTYIPLAVRFKLDKCGLKLSLDQWQQLPEGNRWALLGVRCESGAEIADYRRQLQALIRVTTGDEPRMFEVGSGPWDDPDVPNQVTRKALEFGAVPPTPYQWRCLTPLQRFALIKLSRDGDHGRNFMPALREFELL